MKQGGWDILSMRNLSEMDSAFHYHDLKVVFLEFHAQAGLSFPQSTSKSRQAQEDKLYVFMRAAAIVTAFFAG